jgi:cytochrome P450
MQDLFTGGAETSSTLAEWVMSELMRHPGEMAKAQAEVREAFDNINPRYHESHMDKLHYTRLVIKETLRLHPILPLLIPRLCRETCEIGGFEVTKCSTVVINAWAMARNPKYWDDPEEFRPTRFENSMADYKGSEFYYLPFGSGRRMCPGLGFGMAALELIVARLLYYFDWSLPGKILPEVLDMETIVGATAKRRNQLHLVATPYDVPIPFEI